MDIVDDESVLLPPAFLLPPHVRSPKRRLYLGLSRSNRLAPNLYASPFYNPAILRCRFGKKGKVEEEKESWNKINNSLASATGELLLLIPCSTALVPSKKKLLLKELIKMSCDLHRLRAGPCVGSDSIFFSHIIWLKNVSIAFDMTHIKRNGHGNNNIEMRNTAMRTSVIYFLVIHCRILAM